MTGAVLTLDIRNTDDALARLLEAASDLKPALKNIGVELERSTKERIAREESPDGSHFAPLNPLYAKTKKGPGILRGESGDLANIVWQLAGDDTVEVGTNAIYGAIPRPQQAGRGGGPGDRRGPFPTGRRQGAGMSRQGCTQEPQRSTGSEKHSKGLQPLSKPVQRRFGDDDAGRQECLFTGERSRTSLRMC